MRTQRPVAIQPAADFELSGGNVVDLTEFTPLPHRSPREMYAASAFAALALGFGCAAIGSIVAVGRRSRCTAANSVAAVSCALAAAIFRLAARPASSSTPSAQIPIVDRNELSTTDYSIIVPVYNRSDLLRQLFAKLSALHESWADLGSGEIVVIDDGSVDETAATARELGDRMPLPVRVISKPNGGVSSARNLGFAVARGRIGVVIDSDCLPESGWLPSMVSSIRRDPHLLAFARIRDVKRPVYPLQSMPDRKGFVGASYAMLRNSYLKIGGCYEKYGASHDDRDLCLTALENGFRVGHPKDAWIHHPLRRETIRSMWKAGLNSRFGNLCAARHGLYAAQVSSPTPYYFFGLGSNYGSSILALVAVSNLMICATNILTQPAARLAILRQTLGAVSVASIIYVAGVCALGIRVGASVRELPEYVGTLASFQLATFLGRLRGSFEFGVFLL